MTYRDPATVERQRLREVSRALEQNKNAVSELTKERADLDRTLAKKRSLPVLENLRVASPCGEDWSAMQGDDRVRHCDKCDKNVFDLSAMTRAEAETFVANIEGSACVRFFRRTDGTVMTSDCPVGVRRRRRRRVASLLVAAGSAGLLASAVMPRIFGSSRRTMGSIATEQHDAPVLGKVDAPPAMMGSVSRPDPAVPSAEPRPVTHPPPK
jgi:hypothetical protein